MTRFDAWPERLVLSAVLAIAALISYTHLREVWIAAHSPWPDLGPLTVDGLFAAAWLRIRRRRREGLEAGWLAWLALSIALVATVAGNITAALAGWTPLVVVLVVAAWPALAFTLVWELVTGHGSRPTSLPPRALPAPPAHVEASPAEPEEPQFIGLEASGDDLEELQARLLREGAGRTRLQEELGITEWQARELIREHRRGLEAPGAEREAGA